MIVALIDNGSLEPEAHRKLRSLAAALSDRTSIVVEPVSWKHSDRIRPELLDGYPAATLVPWVRRQFALGERDFVFLPFFVSPQGAIGSALRDDLERLRAELGDFHFEFTAGLVGRGIVARIATARIRETIAANRLVRPAVVVVDHGGPSAASAQVRNYIAAEVARALRDEISGLTPASLEGEDYEHTRPLLADALNLPGFDRGDVVIAPLFLTPGRHAGPRGDLAQIATAAEDRLTPLRCHFTQLVGTHPLVAETLADALYQTLSTFHAAA